MDHYYKGYHTLQGIAAKKEEEAREEGWKPIILRMLAEEGNLSFSEVAYRFGEAHARDIREAVGQLLSEKAVVFQDRLLSLSA